MCDSLASADACDFFLSVLPLVPPVLLPSITQSFHTQPGLNALFATSPGYPYTLTLSQVNGTDCSLGYVADAFAYSGVVNLLEGPQVLQMNASYSNIVWNFASVEELEGDCTFEVEFSRRD